MDVLRVVLLVLLGITGLFQVLLVLLHKGKGGGLSDMFGGGMSASVGSSGVAERNLNRLTIGMALLWAAVVILLGLVERFDPST
ncbi:preprotein translocase subunit SecG [uncultured Pseudokineococcus sp.]|uniref:preprotein translocase subunit SecG n=1 Tax=uncultured Pseudokineococcus sp. TaxID=1642928 RepID=UPI00341A1309